MKLIFEDRYGIIAMPNKLNNGMGVDSLGVLYLLHMVL